MNVPTSDASQRRVQVPVGRAQMEGDLVTPKNAAGVVLFAHGSGSSRFSPRNRHVAGILQAAGLATLLMDLLTPEEERIDATSGHLRFDIGLLADRLLLATDWVRSQHEMQNVAIGYFGASTGGGAAL